jgi:hypothetical protein
MEFSKIRLAKAVNGRRCNVCTSEMAIGNSKFISGHRLLQQCVERMLKKVKTQKEKTLLAGKNFLCYGEDLSANLRPTRFPRYPENHLPLFLFHIGRVLSQ